MSNVDTEAYLKERAENYAKYRGKCYEYARKEQRKNPFLRLVRGHYICPIWGKQAHWWCEDVSTNKIVDPTKLQFPSGGLGEYIEYDGTCVCAECGRLVQEKDVTVLGNYGFCSGYCAGAFVGVPVTRG